MSPIHFPKSPGSTSKTGLPGQVAPGPKSKQKDQPRKPEAQPLSQPETPATRSAVAANLHEARSLPVSSEAVSAKHPGMARFDVHASMSSRPTHQSPRTDNVAQDAAAIERSLDVANTWSVLRKHTTKKDLADVKNMCVELNPQRWQELYVNFWDKVLETQALKPVELRERDQKLPDNWFKEPFYYTYVQYFGTDPGKSTATFDGMIKMLDYLEDAGIKNVFVLPHYESPMGDGGYDVSDFKPRQNLGGQEAFDRFMKVANERGFRVATDLPANHTSVQHKWFQEALAGDEKKLNYYLRRDGREKIGEENRDGDIIAVYKDPDGTITKRTLIFPDVDREQGERFNINGREVNIYQEFYPFQLDLDLTNPDVLDELFGVLGGEANSGVLGQRSDAIAHWIKKPGTAADGLDETHAVHGLLKSFNRHVSPKSIILPEAVRSAGECAKYCGVPTQIRGKDSASEGDALFNFDMQGALREMIYFQTTQPFWDKALQVPELPADAGWLNLLEHHDESYLGMISNKNREHLGKYIKDRGGQVYKAGMSAGGRYADCLDHNPERIANAIFALYMAPGTPVVYYGLEVGAANQPEHARARQDEQHKILQDLGVDVPHDKCFDPRELQRGPVSRQRFDEARDQGYPPHAVFKRLNQLRAERPSLSSKLLTPVDDAHDNVLSMVKFTDDDSDTPILSLCNLSSEPQRLRLPLDQLRAKLGVPDGRGFDLVDLMGDAPNTSDGKLNYRIVGDRVEIDLPGFSHALLDRSIR